MEDNYFENQLRKSISAEGLSAMLTEINDSTGIFAELATKFPVTGSKIDWSFVPNSIERFVINDDHQNSGFKEFFEEIVEKFEINGKIFYAGDGLIDFALHGEIRYFRMLLDSILNIPQHHYFIANDLSWCICLGTEGYVGFGLRPRDYWKASDPHFS